MGLAEFSNLSVKDGQRFCAGGGLRQETQDFKESLFEQIAGSRTPAVIVCYRRIDKDIEIWDLWFAADLDLRDDHDVAVCELTAHFEALYLGLMGVNIQTVSGHLGVNESGRLVANCLLDSFAKRTDCFDMPFDVELFIDEASGVNLVQVLLD